MQKNTFPHDHGQALSDILRAMPEPVHFDKAADIFKQLCDSSRLRILWLLCHCEECGVNIAAAVGMSGAAVSHHLKSLKLHGLITSRRAGKEVYYTISDTKTAALIHRMVDDYFQLSCPNKGLHSHKNDT